MADVALDIVLRVGDRPAGLFVALEDRLAAVRELELHVALRVLGVEEVTAGAGELAHQLLVALLVHCWLLSPARPVVPPRDDALGPMGELYGPMSSPVEGPAHTFGVSVPTPGRRRPGRPPSPATTA